MVISCNVVGNDHIVKDSLNNQDFLVKGNHFAVIADGCSSSKYSEVGTRLMLQMFETMEDKNKSEKFVENITKCLENILTFGEAISTSFLEKLVEDNLHFTLLSVFEEKDEFVVYMLGDGYIISKNTQDEISFVNWNYNQNMPPYIIYNYTILKDKESKLEFKEYHFSKKLFKAVGVATDGIEPALSSELKSKFVDILQNKGNLPEAMVCNRLKNFIKTLHRPSFYDDTTLAYISPLDNVVVDNKKGEEGNGLLGKI